MQDKGHNTANSPTFEIMSHANYAYKNQRSILSYLLNIKIFKKYSVFESYSSQVFF